MFFMAMVAALLQASPETTETPESLGVVEFVRQPTLRLSHSIKVFVVEGDQRLRYLDDIGSGGSRKLTLAAPPGTHEFVVIVQPAGAEGVSRGAPSDPERRREPNAVVEVEAGRVTTVEIGGFTDFTRAPDQYTDGQRNRTPSNTPEASQFVTRINVGKPRDFR